MKREIRILVVSPRRSLFRAVFEGAVSVDNSIQIAHSKNAKEALSVIDQIGFGSDPLQIYLDSTYSSVEAEKFLQLLDQEFRGISRNSVVIIDNPSNVSGLIGLALAECVWDVLNFPVLPVEVETIIRKRFHPTHSSVHLNQVA